MRKRPCLEGPFLVSRRLLGSVARARFAPKRSRAPGHARRPRIGIAGGCALRSDVGPAPRIDRADGREPFLVATGGGRAGSTARQCPPDARLEAFYVGR